MSFCQTHGQGGKYSVCGQCRLDEAFAAGRDAGLEEAAYACDQVFLLNRNSPKGSVSLMAARVSEDIADYLRALKGKK